MVVLEYFDTYERPGNGFITSITMYISMLSVYYLLLDFAWLKQTQKGECGETESSQSANLLVILFKQR